MSATTQPYEIDNGVTYLEDVPAEELLIREIRISRIEQIPSNLIENDGVILDTELVDKLVEKMLAEENSLEEIVVRAIFNEEGKIIYQIAAGSHTAYALSLVEERTGMKMTCPVRVIYGATDEELYDHRIIAAVDIKSVRFANMVVSIRASFLSRTWQSENINRRVANGQLDVSQALTLVYNNSSGEILKLNESERQELVDWVKSKVVLWGVSFSTITTELRIAKKIAPDLIVRVRQDNKRRKGRNNEGLLSPFKLEVLAKYFPGDFRTQRRLAKIVITYNIVTSDMEKLATALATAEKKYALDKLFDEISTNPIGYLLRTDAILKVEQRTDKDLESLSKESDRLMAIIKVLDVMVKLLQRRPNSPRDRAIIEGSYNIMSRRLQILGHESDFEYSAIRLDRKGEVTFNLKDGYLSYNKELIELSDTETELLWLLIINKGNRVSYEVLEYFIKMGTDSEVDIHTIINTLMQKMEFAGPKLSNRISLNNKGCRWQSNSDI